MKRTSPKRFPIGKSILKLGAFWHTEFGPLNQVIHVWPYESVDQRNEIRAEASKDPNWPPANDPDMYIHQEAEIFTPAPFMRPMGGDQALGNVYECASTPTDRALWARCSNAGRQPFPTVKSFHPWPRACPANSAPLNKWVHIWPYKDMAERDRIREAAGKTRIGRLPPGNFCSTRKNKLLAPASFSPMH